MFMLRFKELKIRIRVFKGQDRLAKIGQGEGQIGKGVMQIFSTFLET